DGPRAGAGARASVGKVRAATAQLGGLAATGPAPGRAAWPLASASRRGPAVPGSGGYRWRQGARRRRCSGRGEAGRRPRGSRTPEPGSIVVGAEGRGSKTALETREAAPWSLSRRVRGEASASRPSRASRASYSGDEEPSRHPAQIAAAAGRLHCLTITRAGFSTQVNWMAAPSSSLSPPTSKGTSSPLSGLYSSFLPVPCF
ncbi:hypothetical protein EI555_000768, partial [Monodon monoceros]